MTREEFLKTFPRLIKNYQPAQVSLDHVKNVSMLMIIGPSGVGKSSIINLLGVPYVVSDTTRSIRPGEQEGIDMHFLKNYMKVIKDIQEGRFLQVAFGPAGDFYATRASSYPKSGWAVMPPVADVVSIFRKLGFAKTISAFITPPSYQEWMRRIKSHPVTPEQLTKRLAEAKRSLDFALKDAETHFILNDDLSEAVLQVKQLVQGETDANREELACKAAQEILDSIN